MYILLLTSHGLVWLAAILGVFRLKQQHPGSLRLFWIASAIAAATQLAWLLWAGIVYPYCVLFDAWGMLAVLVLAVLGICFASSRHFRSPHLAVGVLCLLAAAVALGQLAFPRGTRPDPEQIDALRSMHIFLMVIGYAVLMISCVTGVLFLTRSQSLKSNDPLVDGLPWPALTSIDRFYMSSTGWGLLLIAAAIVLGVVGIPSAGRAAAVWYADPTVWLTLIGFGCYACGWLVRRSRGFCNRAVVVAGTMGFVCVALAFFAGTLLHCSVHPY